MFNPHVHSGFVVFCAVSASFRVLAAEITAGVLRPTGARLLSAPHLVRVWFEPICNISNEQPFNEYWRARQNDDREEHLIGCP